jgi:ubiquinone biosynthesis protein UbiJ
VPREAEWSGAGELGEAAAAAQLAQDGKVQLDGDQSVLTTFAGLLDKFDPDFDLVTP